MTTITRLLISLLLAVPTVMAQDLITNGSFDKDAANWRNQSARPGKADDGWSASAGRNGSGCVSSVCTSTDPKQMHIWRCVVREAPHGKRLRFAGFVRGAQVGFVGICVQVRDRDGKELLQFGTTQGRHDLTGDFDWTRIDGTVAVPSDAGEVHLLTMLSGGGEVSFDDIELVVDGDATSDDFEQRFGSGKPGLFELRGEYTVTRRKGFFSTKKTDEQPTLLFPVPLAYGAQVPLSYEIEVTPEDQLVSTRIYEDKPGNFVAEVVLETPADDASTEVRWRSIVACGPSDFSRLPKTVPLPSEWPAEARPWLASTRICQSDDPELQAEGKAIRGDSDDVMVIVDATLQRTATIFEEQRGRCFELDALQALERQGSCTSNANLVAALLRAQGVPARVLAGYPVWSGPLQTHYIVEAYVPTFGWYPIESTMLRAGWPGHGQIQVSIVPIEYEGDPSKPREFAAGGVPYLSLTEVRHAPGLFMQSSNVDGKQHCDHVAEQVQVIVDLDGDGWAELLGEARTRWLEWLSTREQALPDCAMERRSDEWLDIETGAALRSKLGP